MEQVQRLTATPYAEREPKLEIYFGFLLLQLGGSHGKGDRKIVGVRWDGGHQENTAHWITNLCRAHGSQSLKWQALGLYACVCTRSSVCMF